MQHYLKLGVIHSFVCVWVVGFFLNQNVQQQHRQGCLIKEHFVTELSMFIRSYPLAFRRVRLNVHVLSNAFFWALNSFIGASSSQQPHTANSATFSVQIHPLTHRHARAWGHAYVTIPQIKKTDKQTCLYTLVAAEGCWVSLPGRSNYFLKCLVRLSLIRCLGEGTPLLKRNV